VKKHERFLEASCLLSGSKEEHAKNLGHIDNLAAFIALLCHEETGGKNFYGMEFLSIVLP
jgi:hypothetical protein